MDGAKSREKRTGDVRLSLHIFTGFIGRGTFFLNNLSDRGYNPLLFYTALPNGSEHPSEYHEYRAHNGCIVTASSPDNPQPPAASNHDPPVNPLTSDSNYPYATPNFYNRLVLTIVAYCVYNTIII